jgi:cytoskeletal protein CcmA (bactofilin family)
MFGGKHAEGPTVVGEGAVIVGTLTARGRVQIDGVVEGSVKVQGQVSVGPKGRVEGDLMADNVAVGGEVKGRVVARGHLQVVASGRLYGDVHYGTLQVERGAVLEGRTLHGEPTEPSTDGAPQDIGNDAVELTEPVQLRASQRPQAAAS